MSDCNVSRSASQTSSAASSASLRRRRQDGRRATAHRSREGHGDHAIVARSVCWRGSASRPPFSRSSCLESRSRICCGVRARVRAAASSTARKAVQPSAELADLGAGLEPRRAEELDRLSFREGRHGVLHLALDTEHLAARHEQLKRGALGQQRRQIGGCFDHLLEVVEQDQHLAPSDVVGQAVARAERSGDRLRDQRRVAQRRKWHPDDGVAEIGHETPTPPRSRPCLARATGP